MKNIILKFSVLLLVLLCSANSYADVQFSNNATSLVADVGGISDVDTTVTVTTGEGALFPALTSPDYFMVTLVDSSGNREIVKCTGRATDVLTIVRAQEGTAARAFAAGSVVAHRLTAGVLDKFVEGVHLSEYASINAAITDIGAAEVNLIIDTDGTLSQNETIPATTKLIFIEGNTVTTTGYTVTVAAGVNGVDCRLDQQIWNGTGKVVYGEPGLVTGEMWGGVADGATAGQEVFHQYALDSATGNTLKLLEGTYLYSNPLILSSWDKIDGMGQFISILKADANMDDAVLETVDFDDWDADGIHNDAEYMPQNIYLTNFSINGNAANNASGRGIQAYWASYRMQNLVIEKCKDEGIYSNGARTLGTTYPLGTEDNYNPNGIAINVKVFRSESASNIVYKGPPDTQWNLITSATSQAGHGLELFEDINIIYMHAYSNKLANYSMGAGFNAHYLEARDGYAEGIRIQTTGKYYVGACDINNNDKDAGSKPSLHLVDGQGQIVSAYIAGLANGTEDLIQIDDGSPKLGHVRLYSNNGTGRALDVASDVTHMELASADVEGFTPNNLALVRFAASRSWIGSLNMNSSGMVNITADADTNVFDSIRIISPYDLAIPYDLLVAGDSNFIKEVFLKGCGGEDDVIGVKVTGNNNVISQMDFQAWGGTDTDQRFADSGSDNILKCGMLCFEDNDTNGENLQIHGATRLNTNNSSNGTLPDADDQYGIVKTFTMIADSGTDYTLTITNLDGAGPTTRTFDDVGDSEVYQWIKNGWMTIKTLGTS